MLAERLSWRHPDAGFDADTDRGWVARILATPVRVRWGPAPHRRSSWRARPDGIRRALRSSRCSAIGVAAFILIAYEQAPGLVPAWPRLRSGRSWLLSSIYYAGAEASAAYAMYMAWVVIAAALFLDTRLILAHGVLAIAAYAFVLSMLEGTDGLDAAPADDDGRDGARRLRWSWAGSRASFVRCCNSSRLRRARIR